MSLSYVRVCFVRRLSERASQPDTVERAHKDVATYALLTRAADASRGGAEGRASRPSWFPFHQTGEREGREGGMVAVV